MVALSIFLDGRWVVANALWLVPHDCDVQGRNSVEVLMRGDDEPRHELWGFHAAHARIQ